MHKNIDIIITWNPEESSEKLLIYTLRSIYQTTLNRGKIIIVGPEKPKKLKFHDVAFFKYNYESKFKHQASLARQLKHVLKSYPELSRQFILWNIGYMNFVQLDLIEYINTINFKNLNQSVVHSPESRFTPLNRARKLTYNYLVQRHKDYMDFETDRPFLFNKVILQDLVLPLIERQGYCIRSIYGNEFCEEIQQLLDEAELKLQNSSEAHLAPFLIENCPDNGIYGIKVYEQIFHIELDEFTKNQLKEFLSCFVKCDLEK